MGTRRSRPLSPWGDTVLKRLRRLDRTVVELAAGLRRSTSTVYRWLAGTPAPEVQQAVDSWLRAIDARAVDWNRTPRFPEEADALATKTRVLSDRALRMVRRQAADQTSIIDALRMLDQLARQASSLVAATNLLSVILRFGHAALAAWTPERDPTLIWVSGTQQLNGARDGTALLGRRLSVLNPMLADELGARLEHLIAGSPGRVLHTRGPWPLANGTVLWMEGTWHALQGAQRGPYSLWTVFHVLDGHASGSRPVSAGGPQE